MSTIRQSRRRVARAAVRVLPNNVVYVDQENGEDPVAQYEGAIIDVSDDDAATLIKQGIAERV